MFPGGGPRQEFGKQINNDHRPSDIEKLGKEGKKKNRGKRGEAIVL